MGLEEDHCTIGKEPLGALQQPGPKKPDEVFQDFATLAPESTDLGCGSQFSKEIDAGHLNRSEKKIDALEPLVGKRLVECGNFLLQHFLEVLSLRSQPTGSPGKVSLLPLPTSRDVLMQIFTDFTGDELTWLVLLGISYLNSLWGEDIFNDGAPNRVQLECLERLGAAVRRFCALDAVIPSVDWSNYLSIRTIDYKGDEVRVASRFCWSNISPALPKEIGRVPLSEICSQGCRDYVLKFDDFLKPRSEWVLGRAPRVMVDDCHWGEVCRGLVEAGVCVFLDESEIFRVGDELLLNGMFGVTKEEFTSSGVEIFRLIMNLIPLNKLCLPLSGDVATLPAWSGMSPFFIQPTDKLVISSEDVKCFFYTLSVPSCWYKYLAFNKLVPQDVLPPELQSRTIYLASRVLPMGFLNSVSLAQNVHRNLASLSAQRLPLVNQPEGELRKDRPFPVTEPLWRIYLDNYDLLERVEATNLVEIKGSLAPGALALRQEYEHWGIPRNVKKSVQRSDKCEVQGATVDGDAGVAFPRESKVGKYFGLALALLSQFKGRQKQWQIVCGGLVYFSMFRRPLLGSLNKVWAHIESFKAGGHFQVTPQECKVEIYRLLGLLPLAFMDFRLPVHPQITCSDASTSGRGICASVSTTKLGSVISQGSLRGELPESNGDQSILVIGLFDGIGALRVAVEALGVPVCGYVSVEKHGPTRRVVESHFPGVVCFEDVTLFGQEEVRALSLQFSQASMVILGAGPPCQGVSGLNADRRGALKDERSCLFKEVPRIRNLLKKHFSWCPTFSLMESVASMDRCDQRTMSSGYGGEPVLCDAADITWCHRPRLYWIDWELLETEDMFFEEVTPEEPQRLRLKGCQEFTSVIKSGWLKFEPRKAFPTFTTSRPRKSPGRKPAGVTQCSSAELQRWVEDQHRFPPYQYMEVHSLVNKQQASHPRRAGARDDDGVPPQLHGSVPA